MRDAKNLALFGHSIEAELVKITSLVPTQLNRLITTTEGISWLRSFAVIWVGGAPISTGLLKKAKDEGIRLSPCYGATETTAMVTAQNPNNFLKGEVSLGAPLNDVELRLGKRNRLQIRTKRLAVGIWDDGHLEKITEKNSWWDSGDIAELFKINDVEHLKIIGRVDTAIHSGGETIYPEYLRARLLDITNKTDLPIKTIILTAIEDEEWGSRLVALLRLQKNTNEKEANNIIRSVQKLICDWPAHEKPRIWYNCPELETNDFGKWEFEKWRTWIKEKSADNSN